MRWSIGALASKGMRLEVLSVRTAGLCPMNRLHVILLIVVLTCLLTWGLELELAAAGLRKTMPTRNT
eukprot:9246977-Pyramimonas_sp.AAC.1